MTIPLLFFRWKFLAITSAIILIVLILSSNFEFNRSNYFHHPEKLLLQRRIASDNGKYIHLFNKVGWSPQETVIIYNRVPKTASTTFINVAYDLHKKNQFSVIHVNISRNLHTMTLSDQVKFLYNISNWHERIPAIYHGHFAYMDFTKFGWRNPVYINIVRDPLERFVAYYYFLRYGDDYRSHLKRKRMGNNESFDECVERQGPDCDPKKLWLQVPFFCGHAAECWNSGSEWALQQAKFNLVNHYLLVGITDELLDFISMLEIIMPNIFNGAINQFQTGGKDHLRRTKQKITPTEDTVGTIQRSREWQIENDFYEFAKAQFYFLKKRMLLDGETGSAGRFINSEKQDFHYEKIKPQSASIGMPTANL